MTWLLDTSVYSQFLRRSAIVSSLERWKAEGDEACRICETVRAEVEWGLHRENNPRRWLLYREGLRNRVQCLAVSSAAWARFANMKARQFELGQPVGDLDLLIAATAIEHDLTLATLNARDFSRVEGLRWEDWGR